MFEGNLMPSTSQIKHESHVRRQNEKERKRTKSLVGELKKWLG